MTQNTWLESSLKIREMGAGGKPLKNIVGGRKQDSLHLEVESSNPAKIKNTWIVDSRTLEDTIQDKNTRDKKPISMLNAILYEKKSQDKTNPYS